ncbi:alpha-L-arabinofuranosidase C-terminal domain-containing protein [Filimonas effusa]|uniref:non-reducing end alpha-L-arabinofuranosidase n=1 Tax=Filimonas effusa TaxID=2508721 RepID=A0A4Q1DA29_9BACT|nr:alpha-L-arabinofuranosidase C-terminal domain-containing protein [Filimonas effusa]RXK85403.1 alpha-L-arabinofuranosidase [Filimonas effusa]
MNLKCCFALLSTAVLAGNIVSAQQQAVLKINDGVVKNTVAPSLHGIFFEEISHGGEGGLYAELIQNRGFEESRIPPGTVVENGQIIPKRTPHYNMNGQATDWTMPWPYTSDYPYWRLETAPDAKINIQLTQQQPLNSATPRSLKVNISKRSSSGKNSLVNEGFWGINAQKDAVYNLSFYARTDAAWKGPLTVQLQTKAGKAIAAYTFNDVKGAAWKKYTCTLVPSETDTAAEFAFHFGSTGTVWFDFVSLFPKETFRNRPNGLRKDLAEYLESLKPAFVRWPGGCFVEGINIESAPNWKTAIGPIEKRPGTFSVWSYWSSDGFGYHEYLQFCEDIGAKALYVFNAGVSCEFRSGTFIPDEELQPVINDVLDAIEYAVGPATSKWGKVRAANGHPKPFPLEYVEVGNEQHGPFYARRFNRFYDAIKKNYPQIKIIASMGIGDLNRHTLDSIRVTDYADEHAYKSAWWAFSNYDHFDRYKRGDYDVYVGEYATNAGVGKGNMLAALNDAVYIMGMENNGDLVKMSSYAPLFENTNTRHWPVNLINFNAGNSFARISYYTIKMMNEHRADENLPVSLQVIPAATKKNKFAGGIGLATWDTQTEYKDIEITQNGQLVYKSDFAQRPGEWQPVRGQWEWKDSALAQTAEGAQLLNILKDKKFESYTLKLKARKLSGFNAFMIPFAIGEGESYLRAHIGSWINQNCVFELVSGESVADVTRQKRLPQPIETGRWYEISLEVGPEKVDCYLNGQLLMSYTEPPKLVALAGRDKQSGDLIIKMVNASGEDYNTTLELQNTSLTGTATAWTLETPTLEAENSFAHPEQYKPVKQTITGISGKKFSYRFPKYAITILRVK